MLIEEIPVVLSKFTTTDGTVFISAGPSDLQIKQAKNLACNHEEKYDFLHFEIDDSLLREYKSENWNHFKWYFARNNIFCKKSWDNGIISNSANFSVNYYNNVSEEDFLFLIKKCVITPINGQGITFFDNCFSDKFGNWVFCDTTKMDHVNGVVYGNIVNRNVNNLNNIIKKKYWVLVIDSPWKSI